MTKKESQPAESAPEGSVFAIALQRLLKLFTREGERNMTVGTGNVLKGGDPSGNFQLGTDNAITVEPKHGPVVVKGNVQIGKGNKIETL